MADTQTQDPGQGQAAEPDQAQAQDRPQQVTFTEDQQRALDEIIGKRIGEVRAKHEAEVRALKESHAKAQRGPSKAKSAQNVKTRPREETASESVCEPKKREYSENVRDAINRSDTAPIGFVRRGHERRAVYALSREAY